MRGAGRGLKGTGQHQELWDSRTSFSLGQAVAGHLGLGGNGTSLLHKGGNRGGTGMGKSSEGEKCSKEELSKTRLQVRPQERTSGHNSAGQ